MTRELNAIADIEIDGKEVPDLQLLQFVEDMVGENEISKVVREGRVGRVRWL